MTAPVQEVPPALVVPRIPPDQRAALAWRMRDMLAGADQCAAAWRLGPNSELADVVRLENLRGSVLGLIVELEGARPALEVVR
jgi:hypothetical protein